MIRPYDPATDDDQLWALKQQFERELGNTDDDGKAARYRSKLDTEYRDRYFNWVTRCQQSDRRTLLVAARDDETTLAGYVFLLPERLAMIWDGAVINELYVRPDDRGTGLADRLMERALAVAADQDLPLDRILLDVDPANDRAKRFYERFGFTNWGQIRARQLSPTTAPSES